MGNSRFLAPAYAGLLLLSGMAGLSYEVVWLRSLSNVLGSSMLATSTILATFMAGMAAGSLALGRRADGFRMPLAVYALLEVGLAACALLVPRMLGVVAGIDRLAADLMIPALAAKAIASAAVLLLPTFLMGGTLPVVASDIGRRFEGAGRVFTGCYAVHVFGAATGALLASFVLIPRLGLSGTSSLGALVNLAVAAAAFALARVRLPERPPAPEAPEASAASASPGLPSWPWVATALLSGFVVLASEVVFVRILVLSLMAKVHSFSLMLAVFLVALSLGSYLASRLPASWARSSLTPAVILLLAALGILLAREIPLHWPLPFLMESQARGSVTPEALGEALLPSSLLSLFVNGEVGIQTKEYVGLALLISSATLFPFVIPLGMILPLVTRRLAFESGEQGQWTGRILFFNTVGSVLGPLVAPYLLIPLLSLEGTLWALALLVGAGGLAWGGIALRLHEGPRRWAWAPLALLLAVAVVVADPRFGGTPELDCTRVGAARLFGDGEPPRILHYEEGASCTVSVVEDANGRRILRLDGFEAAGSMNQANLDYLYMRLMAHVPAMLYGAQPIRRSLVICCGTGGTAGAMTLHSEEGVDLVDLHEEVIASLPWFDEWNHGVAENPNCRATVADGRAYLRGVERAYDIITLEPMPPQFAGMTQLYSVEFYESCRDALRENGLVCQWLPLHLVTREQGLAMMRAMADVFPTVQYWEHAENGMLIGTMRPRLELDPSAVQRLAQVPGARRDLEQGGVTGIGEFLANYICSADDLRAELATVSPIRDDRPSLEYATISHGLRYPSNAEMAERQEPFRRAALRATAPIRGFEDAEGLRGYVRGLSIERYTQNLVLRGKERRALEFLREQIASHPDLPLIARLRDLLAEGERSLNP